MEEILKDLEQPQSQLENSQGEEISQVIDGVEVQNDLGSKLKKFKDIDALVSAYNNLQSDYTKKCQALSSLQKRVNEQVSPQQQLEDLQTKAKEFFEANESAKKFSNEIAEIIFNNDEIKNSKNPFDKAWGEIAKKNYKSKDDLVRDEEFLQNYIFNNEEIKNKIVKDYFSSINFEVAPTLISAQRGSNMVLAPNSKPKTLKDATKIVEDMFD